MKHSGKLITYNDIVTTNPTLSTPHNLILKLIGQPDKKFFLPPTEAPSSALQTNPNQEKGVFQVLMVLDLC